ncbi:LuxR C-terminal-related transcriptional regulator [Streptomyces arboris]|uniref:Response regulator transcription factor n=1 Tax=Streptomyces arboris TaxID=2600619 RepID=A0A5N5EG17_9ACTN|nr:response regulator transcription factor [Streptomyces arboris]KAB2587532.1 response regulator transcription factor [Streptomyces arboris]
MVEKIEIGAIDDDTMFLQSATAWFRTESEIRITTPAATVSAFLALSPPPGIVTLDLHLGDGSMPGDNVRRLTSAGPKVVVVTVLPETEWVWEVTEAGAEAYLKKPYGMEILGEAIRQVAAGDAPSISADQAFYLAMDDRPGRPYLYPREEEILRLVGDGLLHKDIAEIFNCAVSTVRTHLTNIRRKYSDVDRPFRRPTDYRDWARERDLDRRRLDPQGTIEPTDGTP